MRREIVRVDFGECFTDSAKVIRLPLVLLFLITTPLYSQNRVDEVSLKSRYSGIGIHGGVGLAMFSSHSTIMNKLPVFSPNVGFHGRFFIKPRVAVQADLTYSSLGGDYKITAVEYTMRLRSAELSTSADYFLGVNPAKPILALKGGLFVGRILEPILYYKYFQTNDIGQSRPIDTFQNWNAGVVIGVEMFNLFPKQHPISFSLQNDIGLLNLFGPKVDVGARALSRTYRFIFSYTFHGKVKPVAKPSNNL